MEESRKQFEEEINKQFGDLIDQRICKNSDGDYMAWDMQVAWWAWQASRAAIEIELPNGVTTREALDAGYMCDYAAGMDDGIEDCAKSIRAAGLKIKGE